MCMGKKKEKKEKKVKIVGNGIGKFGSMLFPKTIIEDDTNMKKAKIKRTVNFLISHITYLSKDDIGLKLFKMSTNITNP